MLVGECQLGSVGGSQTPSLPLALPFPLARLAAYNLVTAHQLVSDQRSNLSAISAKGPDAERVAQAATTYL